MVLACSGRGGSTAYGGKNLIDRRLDFLLTTGHVLAGELVEYGQDSVLLTQELKLLRPHRVQRDQRLVVSDRALVARRLRSVGADLQRDHDRELRQVEYGQQQWPRHGVKAQYLAQN